jgi:hypothetical protein
MEIQIPDCYDRPRVSCHIRRLRSGWTATACHLAIFRGLALSNKTTSGMRYGSKKPQRRAVLKSTISRTLAVRLVG